MTKDNIIGMEKAQLVRLAETLNSENLESVLTTMEKHIQILKLCHEITYIDTPTETNMNQNIGKRQENPKQDQEEQGQPKHQHAEDGSWVIDQLSRVLKGGTIDDGRVYVPETIIRSMGLEDGDWIKADSVKSKIHNKNYLYTLIQKRTAPKRDPHLPSRQVQEMSIVKYDAILNSFQIFVGEPGRDLKIPVQLSQYDVDKYHIKNGDVVDYAFWENDVLKGRVTWKHDTGSEDNVLEKSTQKNSRKKPDKTKTAECNNEQDDNSSKNSSRSEYRIKPSFKRHTIVVIGGRSERANQILQNEVERRAGEFIYCSGKERKSDLENKIRKASAVIVFTQYVSHEAMYSAKEFSKTYQIPISYTRKLNKDQFVVRIRMLLKKNEKKTKKESATASVN